MDLLYVTSWGGNHNMHIKNRNGNEKQFAYSSLKKYVFMNDALLIKKYNWLLPYCFRKQNNKMLTEHARTSTNLCWVTRGHASTVPTLNKMKQEHASETLFLLFMARSVWLAWRLCGPCEDWGYTQPLWLHMLGGQCPMAWAHGAWGMGSRSTGMPATGPAPPCIALGDLTRSKESWWLGQSG